MPKGSRIWLSGRANISSKSNKSVDLLCVLAAPKRSLLCGPPIDTESAFILFSPSALAQQNNTKSHRPMEARGQRTECMTHTQDHIITFKMIGPKGGRGQMQHTQQTKRSPASASKKGVDVLPSLFR